MRKNRVEQKPVERKPDLDPGSGPAEPCVEEPHPAEEKVRRARHRKYGEGRPWGKWKRQDKKTLGAVYR